MSIASGAVAGVSAQDAAAGTRRFLKNSATSSSGDSSSFRKALQEARWTRAPRGRPIASGAVLGHPGAIPTPF